MLGEATLIDGAMGRLLRGDRPVALRAFTTLLGGFFMPILNPLIMFQCRVTWTCIFCGLLGGF